MANPWNPYTEFNDNPPEGAEAVADGGRAVREFRGSLCMVGGSQPGVNSPYDINPMAITDTRGADMNTVWGIQTMASHIGSDIV